MNAYLEPDSLERCWQCGGTGTRLIHKTSQHPSGIEACLACGGTGYGESLQTYWRRKGIVPAIDSKQTTTGKETT